MENHRERAGRRRAPRLIDTDWLVLSGLGRAIGETIARRTGATADAVALDFGCGTQPYRPLMEQRGYAYRGADLGDGAEVRIADDGRVDAPDRCADLVLSFQVLEHVRDLDTYLAEARRVMKPEGRLVLSTHGTWLYHPHPEDHRRWTREGLIAELKARDLHVESCRAIVGPLAWTTLIRLTSFAYALRKIPLLGGPMAAMLAMMMNVKAWAEDRITPQWVRDDNACVYLVTARAGAPI